MSATRRELTQPRLLLADIAIDSVKTLYFTIGLPSILYVIVLSSLIFAHHIKLALIGAYIPLTYKVAGKCKKRIQLPPILCNVLFAGLLCHSHHIYCLAVIAALTWTLCKDACRDIVNLSACITWDILTLAYTTTISICQHPTIIIVDFLYRHIWEALIVPELVSLVSLAINVGPVCFPHITRYATLLRCKLVAPYFIPVFEVGMVAFLICWDLFFALLKTCLKKLYEVFKPPLELAGNSVRWAKTVEVPDTKTILMAMMVFTGNLVFLLFRTVQHVSRSLLLGRIRCFTHRIVSALARTATWILRATTSPAMRATWYSRREKMVEQLYAKFPVLAHICGTHHESTSPTEYRLSPSNTEEHLAALRDPRHPLHYISYSRTSNMSRQQSAQSGCSSATAVTTSDGSSNESEGEQRLVRGIRQLYRGLSIGRARSPSPASTASIASPASTPSLTVGVSSCSSSEVFTPIESRASFLEGHAPTVEKGKKRLPFFTRNTPVITPCGPMDDPELSHPCSPDRRKLKHQWVKRTPVAMAVSSEGSGTLLASGAVEGSRSRSPSPVSSQSLSSRATTPAHSRRTSVDSMDAANENEQPEAGPLTLLLVTLPDPKAKDATRPNASRFLSFRSRANSAASSLNQVDADKPVDVKGKGKEVDRDTIDLSDSLNASPSAHRRPSTVGRGSSFRSLFTASLRPSAGRPSADTSATASSPANAAAATESDVCDKTPSTIRPSSRFKRFLSHKKQSSDDWVVSHGSQLVVTTTSDADERQGLSTLGMRNAISTSVIPSGTDVTAPQIGTSEPSMQ